MRRRVQLSAGRLPRRRHMRVHERLERALVRHSDLQPQLLVARRVHRPVQLRVRGRLARRSCNTTDCASVNHCSGRGDCVAPDRCACAPGWGGPACDDHVCPDACNCPDPSDEASCHGSCVLGGLCVCAPGWSGANCATRLCVHNCSGRGACVDGMLVPRRGRATTARLRRAARATALGAACATVQSHMHVRRRYYGAGCEHALPRLRERGVCLVPTCAPAKTGGGAQAARRPHAPTTARARAATARASRPTAAAAPPAGGAPTAPGRVRPARARGRCVGPNGAAARGWTGRRCDVPECADGCHDRGTCVARPVRMPRAVGQP